MRLPPLGSDATDIATFVDQIVMECMRDERRLTWAVEAERGLNLYLGNHYDQPAGTIDDLEEASEGRERPLTSNDESSGMIRLVLNRISNAIISLMAIQAGDLPVIKFTPRETGERPIYFLNTNLPEADQISDGLAQQSAMAGMPWTPDQPLPDAEVAQLKNLIALGQQFTAQAQMQGLPNPTMLPDGQPLVPPEALIEITDQTTAEALQTVFDGLWEDCDAQWTFVENVLNKNVMGWQPTLYEFDDENKKHILTNVHPLLCFFDYTKSDFRRHHYAIYDEPISPEEAKSLYPEIDPEAIDDAASTGIIRWPGGRMYSPPMRYLQTFYRDMLVVRHAWFRFQAYPLGPDEAVAAGKLMQQDVPTGNMIPAPMNPEETGEMMPDNEAAEGEPPAPQMVPETRPGIFHPDDPTTEIQPVLPDENGKPKPNPKWPTRTSIRQLKIVTNKCVMDRECEFEDIPLPTNINIPVPFSPYAQGEPVRLEGLQMALNYVLSAIVTHQRYNAVPPEFIPESVAQQMDKALRNMRTRPGQRVRVPDNLLTLFGDIKKIVMQGETSQVPPDFWKLLQFLMETIDKEANQSDVMQGNAPAGWSGDAIASLQNAASQVIKAKSMMTEFYLKRMARLMVASILNRMGPEDWQKYCSKYPWQALQALHARAIANPETIAGDISIQVTSGSGANKQAQTTQLIQARQLGIPVSDSTVMERLDLDPDVEVQNQAQMERKRAASMPQMQEQGQAGAPGKPAQPASRQ